jgi:hypothetical protein
MYSAYLNHILGLFPQYYSTLFISNQCKMGRQRDSTRCDLHSRSEIVVLPTLEVQLKSDQDLVMSLIRIDQVVCIISYKNSMVSIPYHYLPSVPSVGDCNHENRS